MTEDHEKAGYEFEKGRQKLLDERAAVEEANQQAFQEKVNAKGCSMMFQGCLLLPAAYLFSAVALFIMVQLGFDPEGSVWRVLVVLLFYVVIPILIALVGAFKILAGCACAEDFTDPIEKEDPDRAG